MCCLLAIKKREPYCVGFRFLKADWLVGNIADQGSILGVNRDLRPISPRLRASAVHLKTLSVIHCDHHHRFTHQSQTLYKTMDSRTETNGFVLWIRGYNIVRSFDVVFTRYQYASLLRLWLRPLGLVLHVPLHSHSKFLESRLEYLTLSSMASTMLLLWPGRLHGGGAPPYNSPASDSLVEVTSQQLVLSIPKIPRDQEPRPPVYDIYKSAPGVRILSSSA